VITAGRPSTVVQVTERVDQRTRTGERARETAVEQQHPTPREAVAEEPVDEAGIYRGSTRTVGLGVGGGEVQLAVQILEAVARQVDQQFVGGVAISREVLDRPDEIRLEPVIEHLDIVEVTLLRVPQHRGKSSYVGPRRP